MLNTITIQNAQELIRSRFGSLRTGVSAIPLWDALDRYLAADLAAQAFVPGFNRSTVDGFAVRAADIFGCSESLPAILKLAGESVMGRHADFSVNPGECASVPTGGEVPAGADLVVMLEDAEAFGDGTIGINAPGAPGQNMIFKGDDVKPGDCVFSKGTRLDAKAIGALAALGVAQVPVQIPPRVAILSTGDELAEFSGDLPLGKIRDANGPMLLSAVRSFGASAEFLGIFPDDQGAIQAALLAAFEKSDVVLLSGGTSVGAKDAIPAVIGRLGDMLFHGLAVKPGKPTLLGSVQGKPVFGLPGNPVAAFFMALLLVRPLILSMLSADLPEHTLLLPLASAMPTNRGREELVPVVIASGQVVPVITKSGLITTLRNAQGYIRVPRDCEGLPKGSVVNVILF